MFDYLLRYAIDNIWCNPRQNKQYNYKLRRLSNPEGVTTSFVVEKERYKLPKLYNRDLWHVFQIGQILPPLLNFPDIKNTWLPLTKLIDERKMECEVFVSYGVVFPRNETFILITENRNLLVAVRSNPLYPDVRDENQDIYLQLYSSSYFNSPRSSGNRYKKIITKVATSMEDIRQFQIQVQDLVAQTGFVSIQFVNGRMVSDVSAATADIGDYLECIFDGSIKRVVDLPISSLKAFTSTLDEERKYILHYPGITETIDFFDDVEVYLYKPRANNSNLYNGLLYSRNKGNWLRMLTHKDYSIPIARIEAIVNERPVDPRYNGNEPYWPEDLWTNIQELNIRLYIKHGGYERKLVNDANRTKELYMLDSETIVRAMAGIDSVAECWRAENLEKSRYVGFMGLEDTKVFPEGYGLNNKEHPNKEYIADYAASALGYHSAGKLLSNSPIKPELDSNNETVFPLAFNYWEDSTVFEYDIDGYLLGWYRHNFGEFYRPHNSDCHLIEPIAGKASMHINGFEGKHVVEIPYGYNYRVYIRDVKSNVYTDITNADNLNDYGFLDTTVPGKRVWHWTYTEARHVGYIRLDNVFYIKEMQFNKTAGMFRFNIDAYETVYDSYLNRELTIPFGQYDVFLNGKSLIEGVDYIYKDNRFVINTLEYLRHDVNKVVVRGTGYCSSEMQPYKPDEVGFVEYGVLSSNQIFNVHTNKIKRITIDGRVIHPSDIIFDEDYLEETMDYIRNGSPFQIQTPQLVFREVFRDDYKARVEDDKIDKDVSDYLTYYLPKRDREFVDSIDRKHKVFSCASNLLLHLILTKKIKPIVNNGRLDEERALSSVSSYEWIKSYDMVNHGYNNNHVYVYPHWYSEPVGLEWWEYKLYKFLLKSFLVKELDTASHVYIKRTL